MHTKHALPLAVCVMATAAGCATAGAPAMTAAPPDYACSVQPIVPSEHGQEAQAAINRTIVVSGDAAQPFYQRAMDAAERGIAEQPDNPWHYILAGQAAAGMGQLQVADRYLDRAEALCPEAMEDEILPARQQAWLRAMEQGVARFQAEDAEGAIQSWEAATVIWEGAPNAHFNLGVVHASRQDMDAAVRHYMRALEIQADMPPATAEDEALDRLETRAQTINGIVAAGAHFFQNNEYQRAAEIFQQLTEIEPNSRDSWYNRALALYRLEQWEALIPVAERVVEMDPLNYNARIILFNAHRGIAERAGQGTPAQREAAARALAVLEAAEELPLHMTDVSLTGGVEAPVQVEGQAVGTGQTGAPVTLEFTVYGAGGELGRATTTVQRPGRDQAATFTLSIPTDEPVTGWRYQVR
jgi:tetratricopeptide (TPR) repeat protein